MGIKYREKEYANKVPCTPLSLHVNRINYSFPLELDK